MSDFPPFSFPDAFVDVNQFANDRERCSTSLYPKAIKFDALHLFFENSLSCTLSIT